MGSTLSIPDTDKTTESGEDERFVYGLMEMQGWRITMEDAHTALLELDDGKEEKTSFFAVYDGHGGGKVAKFAGRHVHKRLVSEEAYHEKQWELALKRAFLGTDEDIRADPVHEASGCTAVAALITQDRRLFVANAGDSRSVLSVKGEAKPLSFDHKPQNTIEATRIRNAGGYVEYGRVNGNLSLSRAIGDFEYKKNRNLAPEKQIITADPDVSEHQLTDEDEFFVLACDGIWDCLSSQQVINIIRLQIAQRKELTEIGGFICDHCLAPDTTSGAGVGCDNMTVLIVAILNGRTKEQWYDWIADRVERNYGYETPTTVPGLYPPGRLSAFRVRMQAYEESERRHLDREKDKKEKENDGADWRASSALGLARSVLGGGISFHPDSGILADSGSNLMFTNDDSDEDDSGDEDTDMHDSRSSFSSVGLRSPYPSDVTKSLKAQLDELEGSNQNASPSQANEVDGDGDSVMSEPDEGHQESGSDSVKLSFPHSSGPSRDLASPPGRTVSPNSDSATPQQSTHSPLQGEASPPPKPLINGDRPVVKQPAFIPGGDMPSPAVKLEGLSDKSEDPTKAY